MKKSNKFVTLVNLAVNYSNLAFSVITGIFLVPIYLRYIDLELYGAWLCSGGLIAILGLLDGGISLYQTQKLCYHEEKQNKRQFSDYFISGILITTLLSSFIPILCFYFSCKIPSIVNYQGENNENLITAVKIAGIATFISLIGSSISTLFQAWRLVYFPGISNLISITLGIATTILSLKFDFGVASIATGLLVKNFLNAVILSTIGYRVWMSKKLPILFTKECFKDMASVSLLMSSSRLVTTIALNSENLLISHAISTDAVAIWTICTKMISMTGSVLTPIGSSMYTTMCEYFNTTNNVFRYSKIKFIISKISIVSCLVMAGVAACNQIFVATWISSSHYISIYLDFVFIISTILSIRCSTYDLICNALGKPGATAKISFISGLSQVLILWLLLDTVGLFAVPIARLSTIILFTLPIYGITISKTLNLQLTSSLKLLSTGMMLILVSVLLGLVISSVGHNYSLNNWWFVIIHGIAALIITSVILLVDKDYKQFIIKIGHLFLTKISCCR